MDQAGTVFGVANQYVDVSPAVPAHMAFNEGGHHLCRA